MAEPSKKKLEEKEKEERENEVEEEEEEKREWKKSPTKAREGKEDGKKERKGGERKKKDGKAKERGSKKKGDEKAGIRSVVGHPPTIVVKAPRVAAETPLERLDKERIASCSGDVTDGDEFADAYWKDKGSRQKWQTGESCQRWREMK